MSPAPFSPCRGTDDEAITTPLTLYSRTGKRGLPGALTGRKSDTFYISATRQGQCEVPWIHYLDSNTAFLQKGQKFTRAEGGTCAAKAGLSSARTPEVHSSPAQCPRSQASNIKEREGRGGLWSPGAAALSEGWSEASLLQQAPRVGGAPHATTLPADLRPPAATGLLDGDGSPVSRADPRRHSCTIRVHPQPARRTHDVTLTTLNL